MDKYYTYRPVLDLLGLSEGTDRGRSYNETLGYGKYTNGDKNLVGMTLGQIDVLQKAMLPNPLNSTALGRYQIIRTTMLMIKETLGLSDAEKFDQCMQDRMACFLLGQRGIDKWLSGRMAEDTLINNLAKEWASLPMIDGNSAYGTVKKGDKHVKQRASVSVNQVSKALAEVKRRHTEGQPAKIPDTLDKDVKKNFDLMGWLGGILSGGGIGLTALVGFGWEQILAITGSFILLFVLFLLLRKHIMKAISEARGDPA